MHKREERYAQLREVKGQFESFHNELSTFHLEFYWFICRSTSSRRGWWFLEECRQNSHRISFQEEDKNNIALDWKCFQILLAILLWKTTLLQKEQRKKYFHTETRKRKEEGRKIPELDVERGIRRPWLFSNPWETHGKSQSIIKEHPQNFLLVYLQC